MSTSQMKKMLITFLGIKVIVHFEFLHDVNQSINQSNLSCGNIEAVT